MQKNKERRLRYDSLSCVSYYVYLLFLQKKYIKRSEKATMKKEKSDMKGGKYPQDFQEKLMAL